MRDLSPYGGDGAVHHPTEFLNAGPARVAGSCGDGVHGVKEGQAAAESRSARGALGGGL
jgi:hypothetical protein